MQFLGRSCLILLLGRWCDRASSNYPKSRHWRYNISSSGCLTVRV